MTETIQEEIDPDLQRRAQQGDFARLLLDSISEWLRLQEQKTISRVMQSIQYAEGHLDPEGAVQAWFEIRATRALKAQLEQSIRAGQSAARKLPVSEAS